MLRFRLLALWIGVLLVASTPAQFPVPTVETRPEPIAFQPWQMVDADAEATVYEVEFPSALYSGYAANDVVRLQVWLPNTSGPHPVVLILHYWGASDFRLERAYAEELVQREVAAAVLTLPYHMKRTPPGFRSGELAVQPDPAKMRSTMTQSVLDGRRAIDFLQTRPEIDGSRIGLSGTSLGAIVAGLLAAVEPRVKPAAFLLGGADLAGIIWTSSRLVAQREGLRAKSYTEATLREQLASVEPLRYLNRRAPAPALVIRGRFDTVVPPAATDQLVASLPGVQILTLDTGHYGGVFVQRRVVREAARFFSTVFAGRDYVAPPRLVAPTVRLGVVVDPSSGVDLIGGVDIWTFDRAGDWFATAIVTPRGAGVMLNRSVAPGLSVSLSATNRRFGAGLFWSVVL